MIIISRNRSGAYIICELNGTLLHSPITAHWAVPYFAQDYIEIPDLQQHVDISVTRLCALKQSMVANPDLPERVIEDISNIGDVAEAEDLEEPIEPDE